MKTIVFTIGRHGHWRIPNYLADGTIDKVKEFSGLQSQNDIELHVQEVGKRGTRIRIESSRYILAGFDHFQSEICAELKRVKYHDLEDIVYRTELPYDELMDVLDKVRHLLAIP